MIEESDTRSVVALGTFDGVHRGHRSMLDLAHEAAVHPARQVVAATFDPHPRSVVAGGSPPLLCSVDERITLLHRAGAGRVEVVPFTTALSQLSPEQFFTQWIVERLHASAVVVGHNFRFGHRAAGDVSTLHKLGDLYDVEIIVCDLLVDADQPVSSSRIRTLLAGGDVERAAQLLGRWYGLGAIVEHGARRGRELGMPTANLAVSAIRLVPLDGVYGGIATLNGVEYPAATSVGTNPQFTADQANPPRTVEVHLIGYDGPDFYGAHLDVTFEQRIRGQRTFESIDALVARMREDVCEVEKGVQIRHSSR